MANSPAQGFSTRPAMTLATEDSLYFGLSQGSNYQLWKSDSNGMGPIPGAISDMGLSKAGPNGSQFFKRSNTLRITDGTEAGTITLKGFGSQDVSNSLDVAGDGTSIYFVVNYNQLWKSDGTIAGTRLVRSFDLGNNALSRPIALTVVNGTLYFSYITANRNALWKSDGTADGTTELFALENGLVANIYNRDESIFFRTNSGTVSGEMWYSDGSDAGAIKLSSLLPPERSPRAYYLDAVKVGDVIYFGANDNVSGDELWRTDLATGETTLVRDHIAGPIGSRPTTLLKIGQRLIIVARSETHSTELWAMDLPPIAGDYDADGRVDGSDFLAWQRAFGSAANPAGSGADGNGDGIVDGSDLDLWKANFGAPLSGSVVAAMIADAVAAEHQAAASSADGEAPPLFEEIAQASGAPLFATPAPDAVTASHSITQPSPAFIASKVADAVFARFDAAALMGPLAYRFADSGASEDSVEEIATIWEANRRGRATAATVDATTTLDGAWTERRAATFLTREGSNDEASPEAEAWLSKRLNGERLFSKVDLFAS